LTDLIMNCGIENVSDIQAVEFVLTYIFPRGDVNPLAHRLIDQFENFGNIVDANYQDLMKIKGINERSAKKISLLSEIFYYYSSSKMRKKLSLENKEEFYDFLEELLRFKNTENLFVFAIDHSFHILQKRRYDLKQVREVGIDPLEIFSLIHSTRASSLLIAHNHPNGTAKPSKDDSDAFLYIEDLIKNVHCSLIDSLVVGNDGIYSEKKDGFVRRFETLDNIISFISSK